MVVKEEQEETDEEIKPEKMPKRNGGEQKINLCPIVQQMSNNNKQLMSSTKQFHQKLDSRLDELARKVNNPKEYKNDNRNKSTYGAANRIRYLIKKLGNFCINLYKSFLIFCSIKVDHFDWLSNQLDLSIDQLIYKLDA